MSRARAVVLGAGPTGLSAAYHLGAGALLVERQVRVGGWCRSVQSGGFTFDMAGHVMFSSDPYVRDMHALLLGDNVHWQTCEAWMYAGGTYTRYPFEEAVRRLHTIGRCATPSRWEDFSTDDGPGTRRSGERCGYPRRGGFQAMMDGFLPHLRGELRLGAEVAALSPSRHALRLQYGPEVGYDFLVSTIPLPELVRCIGDEAPAEIREAAAGLRAVSMRRVHLGIGRPRVTDKHWIYYPEDAVFHRIFAQGNASPECNPDGGFGMTCEIAYTSDRPLPSEGEDLVRQCVEDCRRVGLLGADDPVWTAIQSDVPYAYFVHDGDRAARTERIRAWLAERDIVMAGRTSEWDYYDSDHALLAGRAAAETVQSLLESGALARA